MSAGLDTTAPDFVSWFGRSVVVSEDGLPMLNYHGTWKSRQLASFNRFTHFGTLEAANKRCADKSISLTDREIFPVYLRIQNPLDVLDDGVDNNALLILNRPVADGVVTEQEREALNRAVTARCTEWATHPTDHVSIKWRVGMEELVRLLVPKGYDGLRYYNTEETGVSYVPFATTQVWRDDRMSPET